MKDKAIEKITKEAMELNSPFGFFLEEYLTSKCTTDEVAKKLLAEDKSLKTLCNQITNRMRKEAQEANQGKKSAIWGASDEVFYQEADKYFGLDQKTSTPAAADRVNVLDLF